MGGKEMFKGEFLAKEEQSFVVDRRYTKQLL
jgi:hypothetical protein